MTNTKRTPSRAKHVKADYSDQKERYTLGTNLYHLRKRKGRTQGTLATQAKITQGIVSEIESADYNPSIDLLSKIASTLGVDVHILTKPNIHRKMLEVAAYMMTKIENLDVLKLMKLLYLSDYEYKQAYDKKMTYLKYIRRNRGPFDKSIYQLDDVFESQNNIYIVPEIKIYIELEPNEQNFLNSIIEKYGDMSSTEIMKYTYTTTPMTGCTIGGDERMGEVLL